MSRTRRTTKSTFPRGRSAVREIALSLTAALGLLALAGASLMLVFGMKPLVFLSGSMEPHIGTGALGMTIRTPAADLSEGDIISFLRSDGARVTHRIASIEPDGAAYRVTTRGDANEAADPEPTYLHEADRLFWHVEDAGAFLTEAMRFQYAFPFGVLVGMTALSGFRRLPVPSDETEDATTTGEPEHREAGTSSPPAPRTWHAAVAVVGLGTTLAVGVTGIGAPTGTLAAFIDGGSQSTAYSAWSDFLAPGPVDSASVACSWTQSSETADLTFAWSKPVGTVTEYSAELTLESDPTLFTETRSSFPDPTVTFTLPYGAQHFGVYRLAITGYNEGAHPGPTTYVTVNYQATGVSCG